MNPFQYASAGTPEDAMSLIGKHGRYLGGGVDLLGEMKDYIVSPDILVDVKSISVSAPPPSIPPGATETPTTYLHGNMTVAEIAVDPDVNKNFPGLAQAASEVGSPQIRNVATLAGNLLQHSRCWYYRQPDIVCLKRGGSTCYGQQGENKYLSLYSGCACISPTVSNLATMLTALNAVVWVKRTGSIGTMSMHDLYHKAYIDPAAHNSLAPQDFLTGVSIPISGLRSAYRQVSEKTEFDWALVSCAAAGNVANGTITDARVVLGAVAPVPYMVEAANQFLQGKPLTDDTASHAAAIILKDAKPLAQNGYKVPIAHALIRRTLLALNP
jgi:xanthine dehydrogenase YagS FAD-binding subunit